MLLFFFLLLRMLNKTDNLELFMCVTLPSAAVKLMFSKYKNKTKNDPSNKNFFHVYFPVIDISTLVQMSSTLCMWNCSV